MAAEIQCRFNWDLVTHVIFPKEPEIILGKEHGLDPQHPARSLHCPHERAFRSRSDRWRVFPVRPFPTHHVVARVGFFHVPASRDRRAVCSLSGTAGVELPGI